MNDLNDQDNGSSVRPFIQQIPNDEDEEIAEQPSAEENTENEITPHWVYTCCTKKRLIIICLVAFGVIVISTAIVTTIPSIFDEPSPLETRIGRNSCLFHDFSKTFNDSLGHRCLKASAFVKEHCGREGVQACDPCGRHWLPKFCFCDKGDDCDGADLSRKKTCKECSMNYYCPCLNGGTCVCEDTNFTGEDIRCICPEGYDGDYCGIIPNRKCVRNKTVSNLNHCKGSQDPQCFIRDSTQNSSRICAIPTAQKDIAELEECPEK